MSQVDFPPDVTRAELEEIAVAAVWYVQGAQAHAPPVVRQALQAALAAATDAVPNGPTPPSWVRAACERLVVRAAATIARESGCPADMADALEERFRFLFLGASPMRPPS